ncbi:unnamed protein product, partial [marine sediment metagenome]
QADLVYISSEEQNLVQNVDHVRKFVQLKKLLLIVQRANVIFVIDASKFVHKMLLNLILFFSRLLRNISAFSHMVIALIFNFPFLTLIG